MAADEPTFAVAGGVPAALIKKKRKFSPPASPVGCRPEHREGNKNRKINMNDLRNNKTFYEGILRYMLGLVMLVYGLIKIFRIQFNLPDFVYEEPLKRLDGVTLTWAFLGYSPWFSVILGFSEAIPAVLLLFRRTGLLGALLIFPVLVNVFLVNMAYDFLPHMRLFSGGLLMMNITLLLFHYPVLKEFCKKVNHYQLTNKRAGLELAINTILVGVTIFWIVTSYLN
jgi:hypothetical protein